MATKVHLGSPFGIPLGLLQDLGEITGTLIRKLSGAPSDTEVIVRAISEGVSQLTALGDKFVAVAQTKANVELLLAYAELTNARARLVEAQTLLLQTQMTKASAPVPAQRQTTVQVVVVELYSFEEVIGHLGDVLKRRQDELGWTDAEQVLRLNSGQ